MSSNNSFGARASLTVDGKTYVYYQLGAAATLGGSTVATLPFSLKVLLENLLRNEDGAFVKPGDIEALADMLVKVSEVAWSMRDSLAELDINPVFVAPQGQGAVAADALAVLEPGSGT